MTNMHGIMLKFKNKIMEGKDYYITEDGYRCFTEAYHLKRGYCCFNGCKHCPYNMEEATKFDDWMRKINNEHYSNHEAMIAAYKKIKNEKI